MTQNPILIYTNPVPETTGTRFGDWKLLKGGCTAPIWRFFYVRTLAHTFFYGRTLAGIPSGMPVSFEAGSPTPLIVRPPYLAIGKRDTHTQRRPYHG